MQIKVHILILALIFTSSNASAQTSGNQYTSFAGFKLGTVDLSQVQKRLGSAPLIETGDAGEYVASLCYKTKFGLVRFISGEMGGATHDLLAFGISPLKKSIDCMIYPAKYAPNVLEISGLHLGMSKIDFMKNVGVKVRWEGNIGYAFFESKRTMNAKELSRFSADQRVEITNGNLQNYVDISISVTGQFKKNELIGFEVWKVETL